MPTPNPHVISLQLEDGPVLQRLQQTATPLAVWLSVGDLPPVMATVLPATTPAQPAVDGHDEALVALSVKVVQHVRGLGDTPPVNPAATTLGLGSEEFERLHAELGPALLGELHPPSESPDTPRTADVACEKMLALLWDHRGSDSPLTRAVAAAVACASKEDHHLWVDLGLSGRDQVNELLKGHFAALHRRNLTHMGWKKFLLLQTGQPVPSHLSRRGVGGG